MNNLFDDYKLNIQLNFAHVPTEKILHIHIFKSYFLRDIYLLTKTMTTIQWSWCFLAG